MFSSEVKYVFQRGWDGQYGVLIFPSGIVGNHHSMKKKYRMRARAAGFVFQGDNEFIPHGMSSSLHLETTQEADDFFEREDFFNDGDNKLRLFFDEVNGYHLLISDSVIKLNGLEHYINTDENQLGTLREVIPEQRTPDYFWQMLKYNEWKEENRTY